MKVRSRCPWVSQIHPSDPYRGGVRGVAYLFDVRRALWQLPTLLFGPTAPYCAYDFSSELANAPSWIHFADFYRVRLSTLLFGPTGPYFSYDFSSKLESAPTRLHFADAYRVVIDTQTDWIFFLFWEFGYASFLCDICSILYHHCTERAFWGLPFVPLRRIRIPAEVRDDILGLNR